MNKRSALCGLLVFFVCAGAQAQRIGEAPGAAFAVPAGQTSSAPPLSEGIAAIVNEAVISTSDLRSRIDLALLSAGLPNTPEARREIAPQVLRALINEQLQLQEARTLGIDVGDQEIEESMARIAQDNKIPGGDMPAFLRANNIPPRALREQIRAALSWNKYVMRALRPRVDIGDDEIDSFAQRIRANAGKQEYLVSEIFLPVDKPEEEENVRALGEKLVAQIKSGAVFGAIARQFSQGAGAASGGDIGWIQAGQMEPELDKLLQSLQAGEIAGPVRGTSGYHILGVREKRTIALGDVKEMAVSLQQLFRPYGAGANKEDLLRQANEIRQTVLTCDGLRDRVAQSFPGWRWQDLGSVKLATAPRWLADKVANIAEGRASEAMATDKGALMLFVCARSLPENVNRDAIRTAIGTERLELLARRQIRDLRRAAFVDIRLKDVP